MGERRIKIIDMVNTLGTVSFSELKEAFGFVSEMTLRRDLEYLDSVKSVVRIHGGAKSVDMVIGTDGPHAKRSLRNAQAKHSIAQKGLSILRPNTSIFMDSGTTVMEFAKLFPDGNYLIFTNGLSCAIELARQKGAQVYILGGKVDPYSLCSNGARSIAALENVNFDMAFLGATGYARGQGFTIGAEEEYGLKREVIKRSEKTIIMMDSQKVGLTYTFTIAYPNEIDVVISDGSLEEETEREFIQCGIDVL